MVKRQQSTLSLRSIVLVSVWALFTLTLVCWWIYFGMTQADRITALHQEDAQQLVRYQHMLVWEGITMVASLVAGAAGLFYYIIREAREAKKLRAFFAAFTHEIKTPLASARLKSEMLIERMQDPANKELVNKLLIDLGRLYLQLENSLFLADNRSKDAFLEPLSVENLVTTLKDLWPRLEITQTGDSIVLADRRMLEAVLANIFQNAVNHGHAKKVSVNVYKEGNNSVIRIADDGKGYTGDTKALGYLFTRHYSGSGSGIGLYLVHTLTEKLKGKVSFPTVKSGFCIELLLPAAP